MAPTQGELVDSYHGFEVYSPLTFRFLRAADGGVPLHVCEWRGEGERGTPWDLEWSPGPGHDLHAGVYVRPDHDVFWTDREGRFRIDWLAPALAVPPSVESIRLEERLWHPISAVRHPPRRSCPA